MQKILNKDKIFFLDDIEGEIRLDTFLQNHLHCSRNQITKMLKDEILLNGIKPKKNGILLKKNDKIEILEKIPPIKENKILEIPILYEDEEILILNKPMDLIVHKANQNDMQYTLVDYLNDKGFKLSKLGDSYRNGILHRLDKGTSGAILITKTNKAYEALKEELQNRQMGRFYLCVINQALKEDTTLEANILRHPKNRLKYITNPQGKSAKTSFYKLACNGEIELICARLFSGRTHQIRVHLAHLNRYILGDAFYGYKGSYQKRILLHAYFMYLTHPLSKNKIEIYAPIESTMQDFIKENFNHFSLENLPIFFHKIQNY